MIKRFYILLLAIVASVGMSWATTTVTWNNDDLNGEWGTTFTKDGVTITVGAFIDFDHKNFMGGGTFTTTLGSFTKIEVNAMDVNISGEGWSGDYEHKTWTGNASSVSFSDEIADHGSGNIQFVFTIGDAAPAGPAWVKAGDVWDEDTKTLTVNSNPGTEAYYQNTEIKHLIISDGVTTIGESAFDECTALLSVVIGNDVTNIEAYAFDECGAMTSLTIGNKVQTIGESAFGSCESLTSVIIPNSVTSIGNSAFNTCDKISSLTIGSSVQTIGESAFKNCSMLTDVTIPASVENIGAWFFRNCENLATITCKATTPPTLGNNAFFDCDKLTHIYVPAASVATYKAADNWATKEAIISAPPANSITINGTPQVGDNSISLTYYFDPDNVPGICCYAPTLKVKCVTDNNWDEKWLILEDKSSGTETITLETLGSFQAGKSYDVCFAYNNGDWVDDVFQSFSFPAPAPDPATPAGALSGAFTINANGDKIVFSKGNLQATTTDLGTNWTWDFAPNQWSLIGNAVANNAIKGNKKVSANGTVDLFGWSTAATYYGINESWKNDDYAGDFVDWGALMGTEWRTLSRAEWLYIVYDRTDAYKKRGQATVNGVPGYVLLPDAWTLPSGLSFTNSVDNYTTNQYDGADWTAMESAGAVFLPAAGVREGTDIYQVNLYGWYWASTPNETDGGNAYYLYFDKSSQGVTDYYRWKSKSVRLVTEAPIPPYETVMNLINAIGTVELTAECKAKIDAARAAYDALSDGDKDLVTNSATLTTAEATFENVMNIWLSGDCDVILWKDTTLTVRKHAGEGNGAMADYNYASRAPWYSGHWYNPQPNDIVIKSVTIEEGVTHLGDYAFAWMSEMKTATIPSSVTTIPKDAFYWSKAVDDIYLTVADPSNLTWTLPNTADVQFKPSKATLCHVPADLLTAYQEKFGTLNMTFVGDLDPITPLTPEQQQALDAAKGLINAIPSPVVYTPACKDAIDAARAAYDALTPDMLKQLVSNYATLTAAEATYANLKDVAVAEAKIAAIPQPVTLKLATRDSIESARAAYEALNADQQALVSNYAILEAAEADLASLNPGGGAPAGALNGKFTINADGDQIAFAKGNLQATTTDLGANWTWGFAANQWNYLGIAVANNAISGNGTVSENGTVDLFGWSTAATYYGINNSSWPVDYIGDFVDWGPNMGAGWRTLTKDEWAYLLQHSSNGRATVNDKKGHIFLPDNWSGPAFTANPDNFTTNVYSGDDWTAMENAGAVFLPSGPARNGKSALIANDARYYSSTSLNNDTSYVFTIYYNQSQSACTGTNRAYGCMVRLVSEGGGATPLDSAQVAKDLIEAIPAEITLDAACVNAVQAARDAYNALAEATKGALDPAIVNKLTDAEAALTALNQAVADKVIAKIALLPNPVQESDLKLSVYQKVQDARAAYDALTADQKALVSNIANLTAAEDAFAALPPVGSETVITWDKNTGIEEIGTHTTTPAYEGITLSTKGGMFGPNGDMLRFYISISDICFEFANTLGANFSKIVLSSTSEIPSTRLDDMGEGWVASSDKKIATWTGDAETVKIWNGITATSFWDVNTLQFTLGSSVSPIAAAQAAVALINAIPDPVTLDEACVKAIKDAREAVTALGENASLIDASDMTKLTDAEAALTALNQAVADPVIAKINAIPTPVELKLATRDSINNARVAYEALNAAQQALVSNYQTLLDAEDALADLVPTPTPVPVTPTVWDMNELKVGDIIYEGDQLTIMSSPRYINDETIREDKCPYTLMKSAGETSYVLKDKDGSYLLTDGSLAITPTSVGLLVTSVKSGDINVVVYSLANVLDSAQAVKGQIEAIREPLDPTEACGAEIAAALNAYDALSDAAKGALDAADVQKLNDAATQYPALEAIAAIDMIPAEITYDPMTKSYIEIAKAKYDALSDASKALVPEEKVNKLTNALEAWAILAAKIEHNVSYIGRDGELKNEKVALLHIPDPAPDFNGYEFVRWDVKGGDFLVEGLRIKAVYTPLITTNPAAYDTLVYNGLAQELVKAGVAKEGHIEYSLYPEEPESWSAELPQATFAAAYVVYYKLVREGHEDYMAGSVNVTIAKAPVTYTAPTAVDTLVYNASNQTLIAAGQTNDGTFEYTLAPNVAESWSTDLPQAKDAGTYSVYYRVQGDLNHLDSTAVDPIAVTIAKAELTATADNKAIIFGELAPQFTVTYAGWQGDDDASVLTGEIAFATPYVRGNNVDAYTITPSGVDAANYTITFVDGTLTVNRKSAESSDITAAQLLDENLVYTNAVNRPTIVVMDTTLQLTEVKDYTLSFVGRGETQYAESATAPIHVGEYTAIVAFVGNYKDTLTVDFAIAKAPLTITAENKEVIFGENAPVFTVAYTGFLGTDTKDVLTGSQAYACEYKRGDNIGDYTIIPSGVDAHDYVINFVNGTLTVNRKSAKDADIVAAQLAGEALVYNAEVNRPTIVVTDTTLQLTEEKDYVLTFIGTANDASVYEESAVAPVKAGDYTAIVAFVGNYIDTLTVDFTISKAPLTITADDKEMIYGDEHPEFTVSYDGFLGTDDNSVLLGTQGYSCSYAPGSYIGTYAITPKDVEAYDYAITFVDGTLTVNKAVVSISGAEAQCAKFADGNAQAVVLQQGTLNGIKLNDPIAHVTTAAYSSADVAEHLTVTLFYELTGDAALLTNYDLQPTSEVFSTEGVIIEPMIPDDQPAEKEDEETEIEEGIEVYAYGYCDGSGYSLRYHLETGIPDQYKIEFADSRFADIDWTNLEVKGPDGHIDILIPVDLPTGDYTMTVTFRDSRFVWLESKPFDVTFHVNLPETFITPLFNNTIALVDTCNCFTDIQWYWRADETQLWQPIEGATGHYYHVEGKLTGEYFVQARMNGEPTYTCGQADMETLYGAEKQQPKATVKAFPNPVVNTTTVTIENSENWNHSLRVVNLTGVEMFRTTFEGNETVVRMDGFVQGNYMISVDGIVVKVMKK